MWRSLAKLAIISVLSGASGSALALEGQNAGGTTGTWTCTCSKEGTCTVLTTGSGITCAKGADGTCTGSCDFTSSTTGLHPIYPALIPPTTTGPSGPASALPENAK
jgi:hypothetical protein